jgi:hypothetical protein
LRRFVEIAAGSLLGVIAESFVGEKDEKAVLDNGTAGAAAPVVETIRVPDVGAVVAIVFGERVQTRAMELEVSAAVIVVGSVLRDDLNLRAAEASILRVVVVRDE